MEYLIGLLLGLFIGGLTAATGLDRERGFYPTVVIVVAAYYVLFAAMGATGRILAMEVLLAFAFLILALVGFKKNLWLVVAALVAHGLFDSVHHFFIDNPGIPRWWPGFCMTIDVALGAWWAVRLKLLSAHPSAPSGLMGDLVK
jgi:hypothetical protein